MSETVNVGAVEETQLYFGSAVVPQQRTSSGRSPMDFGFHVLIGFHKLYSVALLNAATNKCVRDRESR